MEAIILAGGFGKRLRKRIKNVPKPLAIVNNRPFMDYLLEYLLKNNVNKIIFSVFYKYELIQHRYNNNFNGIEIDYSIDPDSLGTGGAIKAALKKVEEEHVYVLNGDTYFNINLNDLYKIHLSKKNDLTLSLKPMRNFNRFGIIKTNNNNRVIELREKEFCERGNIDGGVYLMKRNLFDILEKREIFSFNDFIMENLKNLNIGSMLSDEFFIDIGKPEDYDRAQNIFRIEN